MSYKLPLTTTSTNGSLYVGTGLSVSNGIVSVNPSAALEYGYFFSTQTQTNPVAGAINTVTFDNTGITNGVTLASGTRITVGTTGTYTLTSIVQFDKPSGTAINIDIWLRLNGVDVANSNINTPIANTVSGATAASNYTLLMNTADYLELCWQCANINGNLLAIPAQTGPVRPASPSVRTTIVQL